ncbi:hypothetical protein AcW2_005836 [Taiwanofungus camphoratus]|nr:hypothetical protein AcW2_005836 [Antrodia cinnamomea]
MPCRSEEHQIQRYFSPLSSHAHFSPERLLVHPSLTMRKKFPPEVALPPIINIPGTNLEDVAVTLAMTGLVPKPSGEVTRLLWDGYNLQDMLQWDEKRYTDVQNTIHESAAKHLVLGDSLTKQDNDKLKLVYREVEEAFPQLKRYSNHWPIKDFLKIFLKNKVHQVNTHKKGST